MNVPLMKTGLIGFGDEQHLNAFLTTRTRTLRWMIAPVTDADAFNTSIIEDIGPAPAVPPRPGRRGHGSGPSTAPTPLEPLRPKR